MRIGVLMGGVSHERPISLISGKAVMKALIRLGHKPYQIDPIDGIDGLNNAIKPRPDLIFNALHGKYGEDGTIQAWLELQSIAYTHSDMRASVLAFDKITTLIIARANNIRTPESITLTQDQLLACSSDPMKRPFVVKPASEGSSFGVNIYTDHTNIEYPPLDWKYGNALIESFINGKELTVSVLKDKALGVTELCPRRGFYDYDAKYTSGLTEHILPAKINPEIADLCCEWALKMHHTLGCRGATRCDFRYNPNETSLECPYGKLYFLEINTQPGLTELSLVPEQAQHHGIDFDSLISWIIEEAV